MSIAKHTKSVDALAGAVKALGRLKVPAPPEAVSALKKAIAALEACDIDGLRNELAESLAEAERLVSEELERRREELLSSAKKDGTPFKRFSDYDRIGPFKVSYKGSKVRLEVGSETVAEVVENDGERLFATIKEQMTKLERKDFSRQEFFEWIKDGIKIAKGRGLGDEGKLPIKQLYPYVVLARQSGSEAFLRKPSAKTFLEYPPHQFVYDLARFGSDGWGVQDQFLRTQTPNMATISQGKTMMLPALESTEGAGQQVAVLWIEKRGE